MEPRLPLVHLRNTTLAHSLHLHDFRDERFDMARVFSHSSESDVIRFAYGEHLLRLTTLPEELRKVTGAHFQEFKAARDQGLDFEQTQLSVPEPIIALYRFRWQENKFVMTEELGESLLPIPKIYILESRVLLYTVEMSAVDGYCASSGARKATLLDDTLLLGFRKELYCSPLRRSMTRASSIELSVSSQRQQAQALPRKDQVTEQGNAAVISQERQPVEKDRLAVPDKQPVPVPDTQPVPVPDTQPVQEDRQPEQEDRKPVQDWRPEHYTSEKLRRERDDCSCVVS